MNQSRDSVRGWLGAQGIAWVEDPSNLGVTYERVRVRQELAGAPALANAIAGFSSKMLRWRAMLSRDTAVLLSHHATVKPGPVLRFDLDAALAAPLPVVVHAIQVLLAVSGGGEHLAPRYRVEALAAGFASGDTGRMTLAGAVVERDGTGLRFYRELRHIDSCFVETGETVLWDGRMEIANGGRARMHVGPLTKAGLAEIEKMRNGPVAGRPRACLHSSPIIRSGDGKVFLPMLENEGQPPLVHTRITARAIEHFCPQSDFALLDWLRGIEVARRACLMPRA